MSYHQIKNPETNRLVNINSTLGKKILNRYRQHFKLKSNISYGPTINRCKVCDWCKIYKPYDFWGDRPLKPLKQYKGLLNSAQQKKRTENICKEHTNIITIEEGVLSGGFGSAVSSFLHDADLDNKIYRLGIPDVFVEHASRSELLHDLGLHYENVIRILKNKNVEKLYEY